MSDIQIHKASGTWSVRAGGAVLGETTNALELVEPGYAPVIYFPRDDIAMTFLDKTDRVTNCPKKGDATHFSIVTKSTVLENCAWSYETPLPAMEGIQGYIAFYPGSAVAVEQI